jgi:hypothetical protein
LAGQVVANINFGAEARVILNEVGSTNHNRLAGFTEVLGGRADTIVTNPYQRRIRPVERGPKRHDGVADKFNLICQNVSIWNLRAILASKHDSLMRYL